MRKVNKTYKIIVDTNIWISFLIGKSLKGLQNHIDSDFIRIITCYEQQKELSEVFRKPRIRKHFSKDQILEFFELFEQSSEFVVIKTKVDLCRDLKDNYLVALAIDSNADFLVTGDYDLLDLDKIVRTKVIKFSEFDKIIKSISENSPDY